MKIDASGFDETARKLQDLADGLDSLDLAQSARKGVAIAQRLAPVDKGKLKASIAPVIRPQSVSISIGAPYARFVLTREWKRKVDSLMNARVDVEMAVNKLIKQ